MAIAFLLCYSHKDTTSTVELLFGTFRLGRRFSSQICRIAFEQGNGRATVSQNAASTQ
jgi:hypothetical protein